MHICLLVAGLALAADPNTPHPHRLVPPITQKPSAWSLDGSQQAQLNRGEVVVASKRNDHGGTGRAVQVVNATPDAIWDVILDYGKYPSRVSSVVSATVYERSGSTFYVDMKSRIVGFSTVVYSKNNLYRADGWMTWSLDRRRTSDVQDLAGYWLVETISTDPPRTRVQQGTELAISNVPGFVLNYLTEQSLVDGLAWVKAAAEGK
jgi:ribosome-associated toxin RatA of RatAB toxin-antitoxin module